MSTYPQDLVQTFRQNTKREMALRKISQANLAQRLGITQASVSVMLNSPEKWHPSLATVQKVADALQISPAAILLKPRCDGVEAEEEGE